ncbi:MULTISPECIES: ActS/PrrB/RegB family redox-sensitive histidine kinase [Caulobacter]|jgi:two-component system sensor histidine kinase RegB|uniref:histidine kinase n=1 Tax=Caulobacter vibrioides OR37 TaxID=1292034 RepID=R0CRJ6_CAUVI|nr:MULTISPECIES: ActS/PrrB/RegB family redox-sensitive histidine kinase [Caulobacter]ENZ79045.1 signal transduction histidine kinase [Caulobacter vibrioides OR37]MBQ1563460.1 ActS/PrrB/RegB family redox-sensitive histidine kinase [Caulobacter sp.]
MADVSFARAPDDPRQKGLDKPGDEPAQDDAWSWTAPGLRRGRLRVRTLLAQRWVAVVGQTIMLLISGLLLKLQIPWALCFTLVALSAWLNVLLGLASSGQRLAREGEATAQIAFDILQLSGLVYLTGGADNPFALLLIAPVTLAAATLPARYAIGLGLLAIAASVLLAFFHMPLPTLEGRPLPFAPNPMMLWVIVSARVIGIVLTGAYAWQAASESARMELALNVTETVLAREQRLSALGALAAAAAHELGTPLATISVVAREMARNAASEEIREDAELLIGQAARCREILQRLTEMPEATDAVHERMSLVQLVQDVIEPHLVHGIRVEAVVNGPSGETAPDVWRRPEIIHAMTSIVENAVDFARGEVLVIARFDPRHVVIEVRDDGPGFSPEVLAKLGEPYVTTRPGAEGSRTGHIGMGLGFFIAKTLLERTGAAVDFRNGRRGGAVVSARWPRPALEAPGYTGA